MADSETVDLFMSLYRGRDDCWGSVEGRSNKEPVTRLNYEAHLDGKVSLGIYPLLSDGRCFFASVDLDEKNFAKILSVRNELAAVNIKSYINQSKSKGFHMTLFADSNGWLAKDVREMLGRVLNKLGLPAKTEIFPKQDKLENTTSFGNYINLPLYGNTRPFLSGEQQPVPTEQALKLIQRNSSETIIKAISTLPPIPPLMMPVRPEKKPAEKSKALKSPPCIERILKGTPAGMRDEAAFALARHLLDQGDLPEEVLSRLLIWDARNQPPIGDMRILQDKVESAEKGYAFGCMSITGGLLSGFCPGKTSCEWLKREVERKTKAGLIKATSLFEDEDLIYEEVIKNPTGKADYKFLCCDLKKGTIIETKEIQAGEITLIPIFDKSIVDQLVIMPSGVEEYGTTEKLMKEIETFIHKYADFSTEFQEWASWWVLMTWVYDRLPSVSYLRFLGDYGTGKSRALDTVGSICYKRTKITGAVTPAAIYRVLDMYRGTLVIDENDMDNKSEIAGILTKILNSGIERGSPIIRCNKEGEMDFGIQTFNVFGPKIFATRSRFEDMALESRCLTTVMHETTRPINSRVEDSIPFTTYSRECIAKQEHLRNKLLMFRFRHLAHVPKILGEDDCLDIDLGKISGRLKQVTLPFSTIFRDNPETMDKFKRFLERYQKELYVETADSFQGRIAAAMFRAALALGKEKVTCQDVAKEAREEGITGRGGIDISPRRILAILKEMGLGTLAPQHVDVMEEGTIKRKTKRFINWDETQIQTVYNRYQGGLDNEDLQKLSLKFEGPEL